MLYNPVYLVQAKARFSALRFGLHPQVFSPGLMRAATQAARHVVELGYGVHTVGRSVVDSHRGICFCQVWRRTHRPCRHMLAVMLRSSYHPWEAVITGPAPEIVTLKCQIRGKSGWWTILEPHCVPGLWICVSDTPGVWIAHVSVDQMRSITPVYGDLRQEVN